MNYYQNKPNETELAKEDVTNKIDFSMLPTPGVSEIDGYYEAERSTVEEKKSELQMEVGICQEINEQLVTRDVTTELQSASIAKENKLNKDYSDAEENLKETRRLKKEAEKRKSELSFLNPHLKGRKKNRKEKKSWLPSNNVLLVAMIGITLFDASNVFYSLQDYNYNPELNFCIATLAFFCILFASRSVKIKSDTQNWIIFTGFLIAAITPNFLGKNPTWGIGHLLDSPDHIYRLFYSVAGSLFIVYLFSKNKKQGKASLEEDVSTLQDNDLSQYVLLEERIEELMEEKRQLEKRKEEIRKELDALPEQLKSNIAKAKDEHIAAIDENRHNKQVKEAAIKKLDAAIKQLDREHEHSKKRYWSQVQIFKVLNPELFTN